MPDQPATGLTSVCTKAQSLSRIGSSPLSPYSAAIDQFQLSPPVPNIALMSQSPSESSISLNEPPTSRPLKSLRVMKLATPAIASDPYTAAAPSFNTSTRPIALIGNALISTPVFSVDTCRLPFSKTNVRDAPIPLKLTVATPSLA